MILDPHAQGVDEDRQQDTLLEVLVLDQPLDPPSHAAQRADAAVAGGSQEPSRPRRPLPLLALVRRLVAALLLAAAGTVVDVGRQPLRALLQRYVTIRYTCITREHACSIVATIFFRSRRLAIRSIGRSLLFLINNAPLCSRNLSDREERRRAAADISGCCSNR